SGNTENINPSQKNPKFAQFVQETANKYGVSTQTIYQTISPILNSEYTDIQTHLNITFDNILNQTINVSIENLKSSFNPDYDMY
ncbi:hypothetical protein IR117_06230, partial [Streptococcus danieliae]|nr:hypothetical protein [Streptococcus danieliae]